VVGVVVVVVVGVWVGGRGPEVLRSGAGV
jgi:hypothetical protein